MCEWNQYSAKTDLLLWKEGDQDSLFSISVWEETIIYGTWLKSAQWLVRFLENLGHLNDMQINS